MEENITTETVEAQQTQEVGGVDSLQISQSQLDSMISKAVSKNERKLKAQFEAKQTEAEKLSSMDETQKQQYTFEQKVKELENKQIEFNLMSNKVEAQKVMASRGLPVDFVDYIVDESADVMMDRIGTFEKQFKAAVSDAVSRKMGSTAPKTSSVVQTGMTKEAFRKMPIAQQAEVYRTNPTLYKELTTN